MTAEPALSPERTDLLESLARHRGFLLHTVDGISDEQARERPTVSQLSLGGLIKHVTAMERRWMAFAAGGADATRQDAIDWEDGFRMVGDETLADLLRDFAMAAGETDELVVHLPDLDARHALPAEPWFEKGASWSVRRVILHLIAEIAQHAGHADIIRESLDGQRTMG